MYSARNFSISIEEIILVVGGGDLTDSIFSGFCLEWHTTFQVDHFSGSGSKRDMILGKILILACKTFVLYVCMVHTHT